MSEPRPSTPVAGASVLSQEPGPSGVAPGRRRERWTGWVAFGGILMTIVGAFAVIEGLLALSVPSFFVEGGGRVLVLNLSGWGWLHLLLGVLVLCTGLGVLEGRSAWARGVACVLVAVNILVQLVWLPAFPIWSIVIIALDLLVLYAIATTWIDWRVAR